MEILAVVTVNMHKVGGGAPIFYAENQQELAELSFSLSRIFGASVHSLQDGLSVVVRH